MTCTIDVVQESGVHAQRGFGSTGKVRLVTAGNRTRTSRACQAQENQNTCNGYVMWQTPSALGVRQRSRDLSSSAPAHLPELQGQDGGTPCLMQPNRQP